MNVKLPIQEWIIQNKLVNVSGTMTALGASLVPKEIAAAIEDSLDIFIDINALQAEASRVIAEMTGAEAGCISASTASGMCIGLAAAITGDNLLAAEKMPIAKSPLDEVVLLRGHNVSYGGQVEQHIRMVGAEPVEIGTVNLVEPYQLRNAINERTVASLWVTSHHTVQSGMLDFGTFVEICHERKVPVIVDAASEYDLKIFIERGADIAIYSGHKFLSGPTTGILAGKLPIIRSAYYHQTCGIGRSMKVGKESIVGAIAALQRWKTMDHKKLHQLEYARLKTIHSALNEIRGLVVQENPDPTGNPITRLKVSIDPKISSMSIAKLSEFMKEGKPSVIVRDHHVDIGYFEIDPCNLNEGDAEIVVSRFREVQDELLKQIPVSQDQEGLGPRFSCYNQDGIPSVDPDKVPWTFKKGRDRESVFRKWPKF
ncbi:MAG: aminotransferase class V-fold PLP-dependent enzyme [SAR324 cluster bacterium]|nr:aminotransferase class V-fold PLP-dependent enzyme [SAR324 cluster bacterium]